MRYGAFLTMLGVKAKVTLSDDCASDILQLINKKFFDFFGCGRAGALLQAAPPCLRGAPTSQTSLLPSGSQRGELQHDHQARQ